MGRMSSAHRWTHKRIVRLLVACFECAVGGIVGYVVCRLLGGVFDGVAGYVEEEEMEGKAAGGGGSFATYYAPLHCFLGAALWTIDGIVGYNWYIAALGGIIRPLARPSPSVLSSAIDY